MSYYSEKFQIKSIRLPNRMYAGTGLYFITICTRNREEYFGEIKNGEMNLSLLGNEVVNQWIQTPGIRPDMNINLDTFQVMPNHFHGIIKIGWNQYNSNYFTNGNSPFDGKSISLYNKFGPQSNNLGSVMRGFKSSVTSFARKNNLLFDWLPPIF